MSLRIVMVLVSGSGEICIASTLRTRWLLKGYWYARPRPEPSAKGSGRVMRTWAHGKWRSSASSSRVGLIPLAGQDHGHVVEQRGCFVDSVPGTSPWRWFRTDLVVSVLWYDSPSPLRTHDVRTC